MRVIKVCHKYLRKTVPQIHKRRLEALLSAVESLLTGSFLTATALGRGLGRTTKRTSGYWQRIYRQRTTHPKRLFNFMVNVCK